jgi:hypothetical protein
VAAAILMHVARRGWRAARAGHLSRDEHLILLGYAFSMYLTGLSIAGVFLSFPFFYFMGILASHRVQAAEA